MGERVTPRALKRLGHRRTDMSIPAWALPQTPAPDRPRVSEFGQTLSHIDDLIERAREAHEKCDWTKATNLRSERDNLVVGLLDRGLSGDLPPGVRIRVEPSDSDPDRSIRISVIATDLSRTYHLKDEAAKTPAQQDIVDKARAVIRARS